MSRNRSTYPFIKALGDELREARENRQLSRVALEQAVVAMQGTGRGRESNA